MRGRISAFAAKPIAFSTFAAVAIVALGSAVVGLGSEDLPAPAAVYEADRFVDSEGVNTQFSRGSYLHDPALPAAIGRLGIRHVRDGIQLHDAPYVERLDRAASAGGFRFDFITDGGANAFGSNAQSPADILAFVRSVPATEAIEAPNEYDTRCCGWAAKLRAYLPALREARTGLPIVGPAFTSALAYDMMGDLSSTEDFSNVHDYFAGFPPETHGWGGPVFSCGASRHAYCGLYGGLAYSLDLAAIAGPALPVYSTETGYGTDGAHGNVDAVTQGKYIPRLLLYQFAHGVRRTYLFQLVDYHLAKSGGYASFGLMSSNEDYSAHTPKPAFRVLAQINRLLADPGPSFVPAPLPYVVRGADGSIESVLFEKRDGRYYLAIWQGVASYDVDGSPPRDLRVEPHRVTLELQSPRAATAYRFESDGALETERLGSSRTFDIDVSDSVTLIELEAA